MDFAIGSKIPSFSCLAKARMAGAGMLRRAERAMAPLSRHAGRMRSMASALAFLGAALFTQPALASGPVPALLFTAVHILWAASSLSLEDRDSLWMNALLLPFDVYGLWMRALPAMAAA